jgi:hypothetical protein
MKTKIQRLTDKKFMVSLTGNTWNDTINEGVSLTQTQVESTMTELLKTYTREQLKLYLNPYGK